MAAKTSTISSNPLTALRTGGSSQRGGASGTAQGAGPAEATPRFSSALAHAEHEDSAGNGRDAAADRAPRSGATAKAPTPARNHAPATPRSSGANRAARAASPRSAKATSPDVASADAPASTEESAYAGANLLSSINGSRGGSKDERTTTTSSSDASTPTDTESSSQTALASGTGASTSSPNPAAWAAIGASVAANIAASPSNEIGSRPGSGSARTNATSPHAAPAGAGAAAAAGPALPSIASAASSGAGDTTDSGDQDAALVSKRTVNSDTAGTLPGAAPTGLASGALPDQSAVNVPEPGAAAAPLAQATGSGAGKDGSANLERPAAAAVTDTASLPDLMRGLGSAAAANPVAERSVAVPVSDPRWPSAVAGQVQWMVGNGVQSATLRLSPEHLGPVEVRIDVQQSQINVSFTASHAETRSALEQTVPRLRELFANSGLTLGQASVQQETRSNSQFAAAPPRSTPTASAPSDSAAAAVVQRLGLIDEYA